MDDFVQFTPLSWKRCSILILIHQFTRRESEKQLTKKVMNLFDPFRAPITNTRYIFEVNSRFGYLFSTFAPLICIGCEFYFCIDWSEFQGDRFGNI